jgi:hypothetical protein
MNGAELPCGTILQVEPATTTTTNTSDTTTTTILPTLSGPKGVVRRGDIDDARVNTAIATSSSMNEGEDDLDEFFESL